MDLGLSSSKKTEGQETEEQLKFLATNLEVLNQRLTTSIGQESAMMQKTLGPVLEYTKNDLLNKLAPMIKSSVAQASQSVTMVSSRLDQFERDQRILSDKMKKDIISELKSEFVQDFQNQEKQLQKIQTQFSGLLKVLMEVIEILKKQNEIFQEKEEE